MVDSSAFTFVPDSLGLHISFKNWRICEAIGAGGKKSIHVIGDCSVTSRRVSSEICFVLHATDHVWALTKSGGTYKLYGPSKYSFDAFRTWIKWCEMKKVTKERDVTSEYTSR